MERKQVYFYIKFKKKIKQTPFPLQNKTKNTKTHVCLPLQFSLKKRIWFTAQFQWGSHL